MKYEATNGEYRIGWKNNQNGEVFYLGFVCDSDKRWYYQTLSGRGHRGEFRPMLAKVFRMLRAAGERFNRARA